MIEDYKLAEQCCIGSILIEAASLETVRAIVKASDFSDSRIRNLYVAACRLADMGETVDPVTMLTEAADTSITNDFLIKCMETTVTAANAKEYAEAVHEGALGRQVHAVCMGLATDKTSRPEEIISRGIAQLQEILDGGINDLEDPFDVAKNFYTRLTDTKYSAFLGTGYSKLDKMLGGGLVESGMIALAARPGVGKSMLGMCIGDNVAAQKIPVLYCSLEMSKYQLMCRRVGRISGISYNTLQKGRMPQSDAATVGKITNALSEIMKRPLYIQDKPSSITDVEMMARKIKNLGLIIIDHMGLLKAEIRGSRYEIVSDISHKIKRLAMSLGIPIVALCQLNRENEGRANKKPVLSDLRDSGAIEEDCDAVILLNRPLKDQVDAWASQPLEINVAKNRHGVTGETELTFYGLSARIIEEVPYNGEL